RSFPGSEPPVFPDVSVAQLPVNDREEALQSLPIALAPAAQQASDVSPREIVHRSALANRISGGLRITQGRPPPAGLAPPRTRVPPRGGARATASPTPRALSGRPRPSSSAACARGPASNTGSGPDGSGASSPATIFRRPC